MKISKYSNLLKKTKYIANINNSLVKNKTDIHDVNKLFQSLHQSKLRDIIFYNEDPIVSIDVTSSSYSCIFDSLLTYVSGNTIKIVGWYDNEYGYCSRLVDLLCKIT